MTSPPIVLLFDLDGTLVSTGGAGRRAMAGAFADVHGREDACKTVPFAGMTDRAIVRGGLRAIGGSDDETAIDRVLGAYLSRLAAEVARSEGYAILPGVEALLEALAGRTRVALGLGTGNVRDGAYTKLARGGIDRHFRFGGFGSDAEDRAELLRIGAERGAAQLGAKPSACRVIVIGDTPRDVAAALAIGAGCVGVGTGGVAPSELSALGATRTFEALDADGVLEALLGAH